MTQKCCRAVGSVSAADPDREEAKTDNVPLVTRGGNVAPFLSVTGVVLFPIGAKCGQNPGCVLNPLVILKVFFSR